MAACVGAPPNVDMATGIFEAAAAAPKPNGVEPVTTFGTAAAPKANGDPADGVLPLIAFVAAALPPNEKGDAAFVLVPPVDPAPSVELLPNENVEVCCCCCCGCGC